MGMGSLLYRKDPNSVSCGFLDVQETPISRTIKVVCNFIQNIINSQFGFTVTIGVGREYDNVSLIRKSYIDAEKALKSKFLFGDGSIILKSEINNENIGNFRKPEKGPELRENDCKRS